MKEQYFYLYKLFKYFKYTTYVLQEQNTHFVVKLLVN